MKNALEAADLQLAPAENGGNVSAGSSYAELLGDPGELRAHFRDQRRRGERTARAGVLDLCKMSIQSH